MKIKILSPHHQTISTGLKIKNQRLKSFIIDGCEKALERYRNKKENLEGLKLQEQFTVSNTFDIILKDLQQ